MTARSSHRLWSSGVVVCFAMAALTLAWLWGAMQGSSASFADQETIAGNRLGAGTVDVAAGDDTVVFAATDMAAGDVAAGQLEIVNRGTLPFTYSLAATVGDGPLLDVLDLVAWAGDSTCRGDAPPSSAESWRPLVEPLGTLGAARGSGPTIGRLAPGESTLVCLRAELPLSAPNRYQGERVAMVIAVDAEHDVEAAS
jgi:hypothetical protein